MQSIDLYKPRQDTLWSSSIEALRHLIVGDVTTLEGVEALMLSSIYCPKSRFFVNNSIKFDRIMSLKNTIDLAACPEQLAINLKQNKFFEEERASS